MAEANRTTQQTCEYMSAGVEKAAGNDIARMNTLMSLDDGGDGNLTNHCQRFPT